MIFDQVMNFSGRIVRVSSSNGQIQNLLEGIFKKRDEIRENHLELKSTTSHFLVLVGEPIPRPSNMKMSLGSDTFITNNTLDLKFTYVSETLVQKLFFELTGFSLLFCPTLKDQPIPGVQTGGFDRSFHVRIAPRRRQ